MIAFDIQHPGTREYVIAGGTAIVAVGLWSWWKGRHPSTQPAAATSGQCLDTGGNPVPCVSAEPYGGTTPTGLSLGALLLWLQDHNSSTTTTTRTTTTKRGLTAKPMPNVTGQRANFAIGELKSGYGVVATTNPERDPDKEYTVTGQRPVAGTPVSPGTHATLTVREISAVKTRRAA